jgi:thioredoxin-like negative regulator of GroEL
MAKRLPIDNTPPQVKEFLKQLDVEKGEYVLEIDGKPVAGVVSPRQVEQIAQRREEILSLLRRSWERNRAVQEEEVNQAVTEAIQEVRQKRTSGSS